MGNHNNHLNPAPPILLSVAGFDPSCGAGTAADLKTFAAHGCYGVAAITALTVQNTQGVQEVANRASAALGAALDVLVKDCEIGAVKIGMLGNRGNAVVVAEFLDANKFAHVVHDPVMKSSTGTELLDAAGIKYIVAEMLKRSSVITPNVPEAEILTGLTIKDTGDMEAAARKIVEMGARAVIVKGGHMDKAVDILFEGKERSRDGHGWPFPDGLARSPSGGSPLIWGRHSSQSLRYEGHRESLRDWQRPYSPRPFLSPQDRAARPWRARSPAARHAPRRRARGALKYASANHPVLGIGIHL